MLQGRDRHNVISDRAIRRVFWAAVWLAMVLVGIKAVLPWHSSRTRSR